MLALRRSLSSSTTKFISPWSEVVLDRLRANGPAWFSDDAVELNADGTFKHAWDGGRVSTVYDHESRTHLIHVQVGAMVGHSVLFDGTKSTYAARLDFDKCIEAVDEMCEQIDEHEAGASDADSEAK